MNWENFFRNSGIPAAAAHKYSQSFAKNRIKESDLQDLDRDTLGQLGVQAIGDQLAILRHIKSGKPASAHQAAEKKTKVKITFDADDLDHTAASTHRRGRPPPDRNEIYHVKMPEGTTARSRQILRQAEIYRGEGEHFGSGTMMGHRGRGNRGTTGVRQAGRPVSPIDKKSIAVRSMHQAGPSRAIQLVRNHLEVGKPARKPGERTLTVVIPPQKNATRTIVQKRNTITSTAGNRVISRTIEKASRQVVRKTSLSIGDRVSKRVVHPKKNSVHNRISFANSRAHVEDDDDYDDQMEEDVIYEDDDDGVDPNMYEEEDDNGYVEYVEVPRRSIFERISQ